jgi:hypothetical protein
VTTDDKVLERHARELYPDSEYLQQQWLRGVRLVRTTARGWLLDPPPLPPAPRKVASSSRRGVQP